MNLFVLAATPIRPKYVSSMHAKASPPSRSIEFSCVASAPVNSFCPRSSHQTKKTLLAPRSPSAGHRWRKQFAVWCPLCPSEKTRPPVLHRNTRQRTTRALACSWPPPKHRYFSHSVEVVGEQSVARTSAARVSCSVRAPSPAWTRATIDGRITLFF